MGTWSLIMPLLSTLAAMVIIVHSFEEGMEREIYHERDVSPRLSEPWSPDYDQSWHVIEHEPAIQQAAPVEEWGETRPQETPKRRRPGRKRKRRPHKQHSDDEDTIHVFEPANNDDYHHEPTESVIQITEQPRRRRKRPEMRYTHYSEEDQEVERPLRSRGQKRRRPVNVESEELLSEFAIDSHERHRPIQDDDIKVEDSAWTVHNDGKEGQLAPIETRSRQSEAPHKHKHISKSVRIVGSDIIFDQEEEKSLSEFSDEPHTDAPNLKDTYSTRTEDQKQGTLYQFNDSPRKIMLLHYVKPPEGTDTSTEDYIKIHFISKKIRDKIKEKLRIYKTGSPSSNNPLKEFSKSMDKVGAAIDALALKELLKRSDGASLSEILQQRNLSLADLLSGRENVISALKTDTGNFYTTYVERPTSLEKSIEKIDENFNDKSKQIKKSSEKMLPENEDMHKELDKTIVSTFVEHQQNVALNTIKNDRTIQMADTEKPNDTNITNENKNTKSKRRIMPGNRRRQRIRYSSNSTYTTARNFMSPRPIRRIVGNISNVSPPSKENENVIENEIWNATTMASITTESVIKQHDQDKTDSEVHNNDIAVTQITVNPTTENNMDNDWNNEKSVPTSIPDEQKTESTESPSQLPHTEKTERPVLIKRMKPLITNLDLRRQALQNRLKKKILKQKNSTIETPEMILKDIFGMTNMVSASQFIAKIQSPETTISATVVEGDENDVTLDDVTLPDYKTKNSIKVTKVTSSTATVRSTITSTTKAPIIPVIEDAKIEIDEILNDSNTGARLSKILSERNMTINELLEHRERGSSKVHLADIFHNTSREPNPPEPFLSKSLIEPISKETYPLRALLEANHHDPIVKLQQTPEPYTLQYDNIPIVMDFGNNVNENGENLGIVSLFNRFNNKLVIDKKKLKKDSEGTSYFTSVSAVNATNENVREGRILNDKDLIGLKEIFTNFKKANEKAATEAILETSTKENTSTSTTETIAPEDVDGDGVIVLEDLQHLNDFDNSIAQMSNDKLEVKLSENSETTSNPSLLEKIPNNAKSVTIATAAIIGLIIILFLLTYIGCKWKNERSSINKKDNLHSERIPTPVFENRKLSRIHSSNRSISPMLSSNIYTMSTLDSRNGKESPDYMWDSLRKPFQ